MAATVHSLKIEFKRAKVFFCAKGLTIYLRVYCNFLKKRGSEKANKECVRKVYSPPSTEKLRHNGVKSS